MIPAQQPRGINRQLPSLRRTVGPEAAEGHASMLKLYATGASTALPWRRGRG